MNKYIVTYMDEGSTFKLYFLCEADNIDHAEEQCENAYPDCIVVAVDRR